MICRCGRVMYRINSFLYQCPVCRLYHLWDIDEKQWIVLERTGLHTYGRAFPRSGLTPEDAVEAQVAGQGLAVRSRRIEGKETGEGTMRGREEEITEKSVNVQDSYPVPWQLRSFRIPNQECDRSDGALFRAVAAWLENDPTHKIEIKAVTWTEKTDEVELLVHFTD